MANCTVQNQYKTNRNTTSTKIMLKRELEKSSNSIEDDDVFITHSVTPQNNSLTDVNYLMEDKKKINNVSTNVLEKLPHNFENWHKGCITLESQFIDVRVRNCLKINVTKSIKKINLDQFSKSKDCIIFYKCINNVDINWTDNNNNSLNQYLGHVALDNFLTSTGLPESSDRQTCSTHNYMVGISTLILLM